jgi:hypothetical protein
VFVSANILSLYTQLSVSASIHKPKSNLYLYQKVPSVSTPKFCLYQPVSTAPNGIVSAHPQVSAASTYSTPEVRDLKKEQRQCLFEDEQALKIANSNGSGYSYSNCLVQCRLEHMNRLCQCAPYFYPTGESLLVNLRGHVMTKYCCETGHHRRFKASVTSRSV